MSHIFKTLFLLLVSIILVLKMSFIRLNDVSMHPFFCVFTYKLYINIINLLLQTLIFVWQIYALMCPIPLKGLTSQSFKLFQIEIKSIFLAKRIQIQSLLKKE